MMKKEEWVPSNGIELEKAAFEAVVCEKML